MFKKKSMKNIIISTTIIFSLFFISCEKEKSTPNSNNNVNNNNVNNNLFRQIHNNTYWISQNGNGILKISNQNLFTMYNPIDNSCVECSEGLFNITYDGCIYQGVSLSLVNETSTGFSFTENIPNGSLDPNGNSGPGSCNGNTTLINFELDNNNIKFSFTDVDNNYNEFIFVPMTSNLPSNTNCTQYHQEGGFFGG